MRSLLIVRRGDADAFARAAASGADAILADAGAAGLRAAPALYLRMRPLDDPRSCEDLAAAARLRAAGVALRAAAGAADVQRLGGRLAVEEARAGLPEGALRILAFATETPEGALALPSYRGASARLAGLVVTAGPLAAALRAGPRSAPVRHARDLAVIAARAAGVWVLDAACDDPETLRAEALAAREDGFDGKLALCATQIPVIHAAFAR